MKVLNKKGIKGVSTVFGSLLFMLIFITLSSTIFITIYNYHQKNKEAILIEQERVQERIVLRRLNTYSINEQEYIRSIELANNGSITCRIRAVYINNEFLYDPSTLPENPTTYVNAKDSIVIFFPNDVPYDETARVTIATERGMKATEKEGVLKNGGQKPPSTTKWTFGPLMLNFTEFYYSNYSDWVAGSPKWDWGWHIKDAKKEVVWKITVTNIADKDITLSKYSCFTLLPNSNTGGFNLRVPWYIYLPNGKNQTIPANRTADIIYVWSTSSLPQKPQTAQQATGSNKVFLTFYGNFTVNGKAVDPYGQTIPFEAVIVD